MLLADTLAAAPSVAIARQLWRRLIDAWALASRPDAGEGVAAALFALPVVLVAGSPEGADGAAPPELSGRLSDTERLATILREQRALGGNQTFAFAPALVAADAIDVAQLSALLAWQKLDHGADSSVRDLPPAPISVQPGVQSVHLRFLIGTALVAAQADPFAAGSSGWAMPFARELARELAVPGLSVLALPRPPQSPPAALQQGRAAQREVGAQLFASNAIRKLRAQVGEPAAVISAHRAASAPGGGELRLSLSSPFDPRQAEGFRCPLFPTDRAGDVASDARRPAHRLPRRRRAHPAWGARRPRPADGADAAVQDGRGQLPPCSRRCTRGKRCPSPELTSRAGASRSLPRRMRARSRR